MTNESLSDKKRWNKWEKDEWEKRQLKKN
jgi:hypothetical protein